MFILYEEIQFINSRKVNSPSIPQFPFTTSMSHDHNYKVQEDLTISTWGNSCLLLGNIARILQINQSCFALCIVMSSHGSHRSVIFVMFFLLFWFHWYSKRYQAMSNRWEHKLERFLFQNDHHFRRKS